MSVKLPNVSDALEKDLKLLEEQDQLRGRDALVELARTLAIAIDVKRTAPNAGVVQRFLETLRALGIAGMEFGDEDSFDKLLKEMSDANKS